MLKHTNGKHHTLEKMLQKNVAKKCCTNKKRNTKRQTPNAKRQTSNNRPTDCQQYTVYCYTYVGHIFGTPTGSSSSPTANLRHLVLFALFVVLALALVLLVFVFLVSSLACFRGVDLGNLKAHRFTALLVAPAAAAAARDQLSIEMEIEIDRDVRISDRDAEWGHDGVNTQKQKRK